MLRMREQKPDGQRATRSLMIAIALLTLATVADGRDIKIGIVGDQTYASFGSDPYQILTKGMEALKAQSPDVVLHTGDLLESVKYVGADAQPRPVKEYTSDYQKAAKILDQLPCPWFLAAGDHDVTAPYDKPAETGIRKLFQQLYGGRVAAVRQDLFYSFDRRGYHFVALSSQENHNADPRWGSIFRAKLSPEQIQWLEQDLQAAGHRNTIVFLHQPLWYQWTDWARVHAILRAHRVIAVVAGHFHYNQDEGEIDGIRYIVVGAAGGAVKSGSRQGGNLQHVTVLKVTGKKVSLTLLPLDNAGPASFSSRSDMDRSQAVALNLGNISYDLNEEQNSVTLQDGKVRSCSQDARPSITLFSVGNPLDVPVRLRISAQSGNLMPVKMTFQAGACEPSSTADECVLAPGSLVESANNSVVVPQYKGCRRQPFDKCMQPLWTAQLPETTSDGKPPSLSLALRMSFQGKQEEIYLDGSGFLNTTCPQAPPCKTSETATHPPAITFLDGANPPIPASNTTSISAHATCTLAP